MDNLIAWAVTMGYDPNLRYTDGEAETPTIPSAAPLPDGYISPHFRRAEFACNHCGELPFDPPPELLAILEETRAHFGGKPVVINSGYRCPVHNRNVGGARASYHLKAMAADFRVQGVPPAKVHRWLDEFWQGGLGAYANFTHVDVRGRRARWGNVQTVALDDPELADDRVFA